MANRLSTCVGVVVDGGCGVVCVVGFGGSRCCVVAGGVVVVVVALVCCVVVVCGVVVVFCGDREIVEERGNPSCVTRSWPRRGWIWSCTRRMLILMLLS